MDERVASAIAHWAPRFTANGVTPADFARVTAAVETWPEWCAAWVAVGDQHEALGREALADGRLRSGGEHLAQAAAYYHFAKFVFVEDVDQMRAAHARAVAAYTDALPHLDPPGRRVEIPFETGRLVAVVRTPYGEGPFPVVLMIPGLDSTKEEVRSTEQTFLDRGLATFSVDGPGQGEAEYDFAICPEYEKPVKAVIDWLETRTDVDLAHVGVWGVSLGGYYAPRAAAFERRIKACVALSGPYARSGSFEGRPSINVETFRVRSKSASLEEAAKVALRMTLKGAAANIACPIYIVAGTRDRLTPHTEAEKLAAEVSGPCVLSVIEGGNHVVNNLWYRYRDQTADWMADQLGARR
jgi:dienelactone hydrolase